MKKLPFVASMLLVALSTAGAMVVGQSFAAQNDKAPCADVRDSKTHTPDEVDKQIDFLRTQG